MKHNTYIFDFDGTLVDSMPYWSAKVLNILDACGVKYQKDIVKYIATLGDKGTAEYFKNDLGVKLTLDEMYDMMDAFALPKYRDVIGFKEGVKDYLLRMKDLNISLNVLTASPHKMLDPCLKRLEVFDIFDNVWSCDDFMLTKSDVRIYHEAVKRLNCDISDAAFFDDNINAIKTAHDAGLYTVGVYDDSGADFSEQIKNTADIYIKTFDGFDAI